MAALVFPIQFVSDVEPRAALARVVEIATPLLAGFGYNIEARGEHWAHWTTDSFQDVVRAYAYSAEEHGGGVSITGQGAIPPELPQAIYDRVVETTRWTLEG